MINEIDEVQKNLKNNNIDSCFVKSKKELIDLFISLVEKQATIFTGGSSTLFETGLIEFLRNSKDYQFYDRYASNLSSVEKEEMNRAAFSGDYFLCSANAITRNGEIYQVDNLGNRLSAMIYGPKKVILVVGTNKIVDNVKEAIERVKTIAAPKNSLRHGNKTYCANHGKCFKSNIDEDSLMTVPSGSCKDTICSISAVFARQLIPGRIHVIFVDENLGY